MRFSLLTPLLIAGIGVSTASYAQNTNHQQSAQISALPSSCVTLHEGRACFAQVTLSWSLKSKQPKSQLCLYQKQPKRQLKCWQQSAHETLNITFESSSPLTYQLLDEQRQVLAETKIDVSWVYKATPRKRRWRIF